MESALAKPAQIAKQQMSFVKNHGTFMAMILLAKRRRVRG